MLRLGLLATATLLLAGCAGAGQKEMVAATEICTATKAQFAPVLGAKMSMTNIVDTTPAMLADQSYPNAAEAKALNDMTIALTPCRQKIAATMQRYDAPAAPAVQGYYIQQQIVLGDLIARKITFGEANRRLLGAFLEAGNQGRQQEAIANAERQQAYANLLAATQAFRASQGVTCSTVATGAVATTNCH